MMARVVVWMVAGALMAGARAGAQTPVVPRDRPPGPAPQTGTARIAGRIVDARTGTGLARARVRLTGPGVQRPPILSDDQGAFQFVDLPAGSYTIAAERMGYMAGRFPEAGRTIRSTGRGLIVGHGEVHANIAVPLYRGGVIAGRITDSHGEPFESAQVTALWVPPSGKGRPQQRSTVSANDLGEFRLPRLAAGSYVVFARPRLNFQNVTDDFPEPAPIDTYFPGVASVDLAQRVALDRGQTVSGVEIMLLDGAASIVSGTVIDATGQPVAGGSLSIIQSQGEGGYSSSGAGLRPDGTFRLKLAPGEYELEARGRPAGVPQAGPPAEQLGSVHISSNGAPIAGLTITLGPPASVSGRLVFDGTTPPPTDPAPFRLSFTSGGGGTPCRFNGQADTRPDWTFRAQGVSGTCVARIGGNGRWTPRAVLHDGVDLLDRPVRFEPGQQLRDVQVIMTDRRTELTLRVADDHGQPTREYVALLFPADKALWTQAIPGSRFMRVYTPPTAPVAVSPRTGTASIAAPAQRPDSVNALPPGEYYVVALDDIGVEEARDPDTFERLSPQATRVVLTDRAAVSVNLRRIVPGRQ